MHKSKFLALLLAVAMVVSMVVVPVYAEGDLSEYTLTANKTTVAPGETVTVTLAVNAANLAAFDLSVNYDETMILTGSTSKLAGLVLSPEDKLDAPQKVIQSTLTPVEGTAVELVTYTFTAPAEEGEYAITVTADELSNLNLDGTPFAPTYGEELVITVLKNACPEHNEVKDWTVVNEGDWGNDTVITSGHYKLNADITLDYVEVTATETGNALVIGDGAEVCIDLNGHTISATRYGSTIGTRVFHVLSGGKLAILDTATGGTISGGYARGEYRVSAGASITESYRGGNIYVQNGATFTLVSGTITGGKAAGASINGYSRGGNIYGEAGSTINIKGGTVSNGEVNRDIAARGYQHVQHSGGGNIAAEGTLNITGGTITGGYVHGENAATDRPVNIYGGNIMVLDTGALTISNATITDGSVVAKSDYVAASSKNASGASGGNIYAEGVDVTIANSTISGGQLSVGASKATTLGTAYLEILGGNMAIRNGDLTVTGTSEIGGGKISFDSTIKSGHTATTSYIRGGNVYINAGNVVLRDSANLSGGQLYDTSTGEDYANINYCHGANLYTDNTSAAPGVVETHDDANIGNGTGGYKYGYALVTTYTDVKIYGGNIRNTGFNKSSDMVYMYDGRIDISMSSYRSRIIYPTTSNGNHCYEDPNSEWWTMRVWHTNLGANGYCADCDYYFTSPQEQGHHTYVEDATNAGHYACSSCGYALTCSEHPDATWTPFSARTNGRDLSGHYFLDADMSDYDGNQFVCTADDTTATGYADVCIDMNNYTIHQTLAGKRAFSTNGNISVWNGSISANGGAGMGAVFCHSTGNLTLKNVSISGGNVNANGAGLYIGKGTFEIENCTFDGNNAGTAYGGNVYVSESQGTFTDCDFIDGQAARGGNLRVEGHTVEVVVSGGTLSGGIATGYGGNIAAQYGYGRDVYALTVKDGTVITGGTAPTGGNIQAVYSYIDLQDCTITDGTATDVNYGGNIRIYGTSSGNAKMNIGANVTISGGKAKGANQDVELGGTTVDNKSVFNIKSGADIGYVTISSMEAADVTVEAGVKSMTALPTISSHFDGETGVYTTAALADAIAAVAGEGDKVVLGKAETADVNVEGYTLDLNGQTLTGNVNAADAASLVIDSTEGAGLVTGSVNLFANNGYLPVPVEGGYAFETVSLRQATQELDGDKLKLKIAFNDAADETLLDEVFANATTTPGASDVQLRVNVSWDGGELDPQQYDYDLLNLYASAWGSKMFTCTVSNVSSVEGLTITASVYSNGVEIAAVDVTK